MAGVTSKSTPKKGTMKWDIEKRQYVCCLFSFFEPDINVFCSVFSEIFRGQLVQRGIEKDLSAATMYSQWHNMKQSGSPTHSVWEHVNKPRKVSHPEEWSQIIHEMKEVAARLGVILREKADDDIESVGGPNSKGKLSTPQQATPPPDHNGGKTEREVFGAGNDVDERSEPTRQGTNFLAMVHEKTCYWCWRDARFKHPEESEFRDEEPGTHMDLDIEQGPNEHLGLEPEPATLAKEFVTKMADSPIGMDPSLEEDEAAQSDSDAFSFIMGGDDEVTPPNDNGLLLKTGKNGLPGLCRLGDMPPILFRWYNDNSQGTNTKDLIRAGLFSEDESLEMDTSGLTIKQYLEYFIDHVTKTKISSPFISTCLLPLTPIQRALKYKNNAMVAIIDTTKLDTVIVKASELVPLTDTRTPRWRGFGEYLVWKEVSKEAIICTFSLPRLEQIANESEDIGELLQLDCIRRHRLSGRDLYMTLAEKTGTLRRPRVTLERLMVHLGVPREQQSLVIDKFEEAWSMDRRWAREGEAEGEHRTGQISYGVYAPDESRSSLHPGEDPQEVIRVEDPRRPRIRSEFVGVMPPDPVYRQPSNLTDSDSSSSEEESAGSEPIVRCPRHDTPSEGGYTLHDHDDDEDEEYVRWTLMEEMASHRDVELFTPSEPSPSLRPRISRSRIPIPLDLNRSDDAPSRATSHLPSEAQNVDEPEIIEVD